MLTLLKGPITDYDSMNAMINQLSTGTVFAGKAITLEGNYSILSQSFDVHLTLTFIALHFAFTHSLFLSPATCVIS